MLVLTLNVPSLAHVRSRKSVNVQEQEREQTFSALYFYLLLSS